MKLIGRYFVIANVASERKTGPYLVLQVLYYLSHLPFSLERSDKSNLMDYEMNSVPDQSGIQFNEPSGLTRSAHLAVRTQYAVHNRGWQLIIVGDVCSRKLNIKLTID